MSGRCCHVSSCTETCICMLGSKFPRRLARHKTDSHAVSFDSAVSTRSRFVAASCWFDGVSLSPGSRAMAQHQWRMIAEVDSVPRCYFGQPRCVGSQRTCKMLFSGGIVFLRWVSLSSPVWPWRYLSVYAMRSKRFNGVHVVVSVSS